MKMKKIISLVLALMLMASIFAVVPVTASAATTNYSLEIGKSYTKTAENPSGVSYLISGASYHDYTFTMSKSANVTVSVASSSSVIRWQVKGSTYGSSYPTQSGAGSATYYLAKGKAFTISVYAYGAGEKAKYTLKTAYAAPDKIKLAKKSGKFSSGKKTIVLTYTGTGDYTKDNLTVTNKNKKVAEVTSKTFVQGNKCNVDINPVRVGRTVITFKLKGSNTVKYIVYVTKGYWFIAKGSKEKAPKPLGVSKPKWKSSSKKVATINKKTGKIKAKKGGRVTFTAKKGKISYKLSTVITDYVKLGRKTYREVKNVVNNPEKLKIYNVYRGYSKQIYSGLKVPVVLLDYGSTNENGAMVRSKLLAYYDDVHEPRYTSGWNENNIIGKKRMSVKSIK